MFHYSMIVVDLIQYSVHDAERRLRDKFQEKSEQRRTVIRLYSALSSCLDANQGYL